MPPYRTITSNEEPQLLVYLQWLGLNRMSHHQFVTHRTGM